MPGEDNEPAPPPSLGNRRQRLRLLDQDEETDYVDLEKVSKEINEARRLFNKYDWPVINVSRKSIEETAATILQLYTRRNEQLY